MQVIIRTAFSISIIISLEQMISRNRISEEESQWTFGQIIALILLFGPLMDLTDAFLDATKGKGLIKVILDSYRRTEKHLGTSIDHHTLDSTQRPPLEPRRLRSCDTPRRNSI